MSISPTAAEPLFYCASLGSENKVVVLSSEEAHHAHRARRLAVGDRLWLFDGRGTLVRGRLHRIAERGRVIEVLLEERRCLPPPPIQLHLACALPKGGRVSVLLDMATQLGMTAFTPLLCSRSVVKPGPDAAARWQRICLEACKQSRRLHLPALHAPATPEEVAARAAKAGEAVWIAHPGGVSLAALQRATAATVLIGPEGGFTDEELAQMTASGGKALSLGEAILRIETAAIALLFALSLCGTRGVCQPRESDRVD